MHQPKRNKTIILWAHGPYALVEDIQSARLGRAFKSDLGERNKMTYVLLR